MTQAKTQAEKWAEPHMVNVKTVSRLKAMYFFYSDEALIVVFMKIYFPEIYSSDKRNCENAC